MAIPRRSVSPVPSGPQVDLRKNGAVTSPPASGGDLYFVLDSEILGRRVAVGRGRDGVAAAWKAALPAGTLIFADAEIDRLYEVGATRPADVRAVAAVKATFADAWIREVRVTSERVTGDGAEGLPPTVGLRPETGPGSGAGGCAGLDAIGLPSGQPGRASPAVQAAWRAAIDVAAEVDAAGGETDLAVEAAAEADFRVALAAGDEEAQLAAIAAWLASR